VLKVKVPFDVPTKWNGEFLLFLVLWFENPFRLLTSNIDVPVCHTLSQLHLLATLANEVG
jgi:hypothetical protein